MACIVFCEDTASIRKLIALAMRATPHRVHIAEDGASGLEVIKTEHPDLVVTDLAMPVLDGPGLYDRMQADADLAHIPVVFLSASTQRNLVRAANERRPRAVLNKPFSPAELRAVVDAALIPAGDSGL